MKRGHEFYSRNWTIDSFKALLAQAEHIQLLEESKVAIERCRSYLESKLENSDAKIYGINTGFGALCDVQISPAQIQKLQENLVVSHACGTGDLVPEEIVRSILLLKIKNLSLGHSGVRLHLVEQLCAIYNAGITPKIYQLGSLGASGDLAPLAHMALVLLGKGEVLKGGKTIDASVALKEAGKEPITLEAKEGLALLNGTQFSTSYAANCAIHAKRIYDISNMIVALSLEAYNGQLAPFYHRIHEIRTQHGQIKTGEEVLNWFEGSDLDRLELSSVQDPYSFRCVPQVHGASYDAFQYLNQVVECEINGVSDNPLIFPEEDRIVSGGNFHAQPIAYALDFFCIAMAEIGSISERRTYKLVNGDRGLPPFLVNNPGLNSGLMITQYTAASIVSQNKQLCTPASIDSITSSRGQEDHVSMAENAATKAYRVVQNVYRILAIELITASQAMGFRGSERLGDTDEDRKISPALQSILNDFRKEVPLITEDRILSTDMHKAEAFLHALEL